MTGRHPPRPAGRPRPAPAGADGRPAAVPRVGHRTLPAPPVTNADLERALDTSDAWIVDAHRHPPAATSPVPATPPPRLAIDGRPRRPRPRRRRTPATSTSSSWPRPPPTGRARRPRATSPDELGHRGARPSTSTPPAPASSTPSTSAPRLLRTPGIEHVLVIGADRFTASSTPTDRTHRRAVRRRGRRRACSGRAPTHADGAARACSASTSAATRARSDILEVPPGERYVHMDGPRGVPPRDPRPGRLGTAALERAGATADDVDLFVPHQANLRIIDAAASRLGVAAGPVVVNIDRYGNTSAASVPLALAEAADDGRIADGTLVLAVGIGAGMAWASAAAPVGMSPMTDEPADGRARHRRLPGHRRRRRPRPRRRRPPRRRRLPAATRTAAKAVVAAIEAAGGRGARRAARRDRRRLGRRRRRPGRGRPRPRRPSWSATPGSPTTACSSA